MDNINDINNTNNINDINDINNINNTDNKLEHENMINEIIEQLNNSQEMKEINENFRKKEILNTIETYKKAITSIDYKITEIERQRTKEKLKIEHLENRKVELKNKIRKEMGKLK